MQIITILSLLSFVSTELISLRLSSDYFKNYLLVYAGVSKIELVLIPDLTSQYSWHLETKKYNSTSKIILDNSTRMLYNNRSYNSTEINDMLAFENYSNFTLSNFPFHLINDPAIYFRQYTMGGLGMGFTFVDPKYSFIHQYYGKGFIDHLSFSISKSERRLVLGGIPHEFTINRTYSFCEVRLNEVYWSCTLSSVNFKYKAQQVIYSNKLNSQYAIFNTENIHNYAPISFIDHLVTIFKEEIDSQKCTFGISADYRYLYCTPKQVEVPGNITFNLGDYSYTIDLKEFWNCPESHCYFKFNDNFNGDYWIFGSDFYTNYNAHFDYEEAKIHFYSTKGVKQRVLNTKPSSIGVMLIINTCLLCIGVIIIFVSIKNNNIKL